MVRVSKTESGVVLFNFKLDAKYLKPIQVKLEHRHAFHTFLSCGKCAYQLNQTEFKVIQAPSASIKAVTQCW